MTGRTENLKIIQTIIIMIEVDMMNFQNVDDLFVPTLITSMGEIIKSYLPISSFLEKMPLPLVHFATVEKSGF